MSVGVVHHHELVVTQLVVRRVFGDIEDLVGRRVEGYGPTELGMAMAMGLVLRMLIRTRAVLVRFGGSVPSNRGRRVRRKQRRACNVAPWLMG